MNHPLFGEFSTKEKILEGEFLAREGDPGEKFFLIHKGRFVLEKTASWMGELGPGDIAGHIPLLTEKPWLFSLRASKDAAVFSLEKKDFFERLQKNPKLLTEIVTDMQEKLEKWEKKDPFRPKIRTLGIITKDEGFLKNFSEALPKTERKALFTADPSNEEEVEKVRHLADQTFTYSQNFFEGDFSQRIETKEDIQRSARLALHQGVGLVLGSGGARCVAQLPIIDVLKEGDIPIDRIGGSGIGALIGALYAMGLSGKEVRKILRNFLKKAIDELDYTFPYLSIASGFRLKNFLQKTFGKKRIEDLKVPFFCLSSDLNTALEYIHKEGEIWEAVRASLSLPGIFPPVSKEGHLLVDGSLTNILPIDIMQDFLGGGPVIAIDTGEKKGRAQKNSFPHHISGTKIFLKKLFPFGKSPAVPSIINTLIRATLLDSSLKKKELLKNRPPELLITPPIEAYHSLDFRSFDRIHEASKKYAKRHLTIWKRSLIRSHSYPKLFS